MTTERTNKLRALSRELQQIHSHILESERLHAQHQWALRCKHRRLRRRDTR